MESLAAVANRYWNIANDGTVRYLDECCLPGHTMRSGGDPIWNDREGGKQFMRALLAATPDTQTEHSILFQVGNAIAARIRTTGSVVRAVPFLPPVGESYDTSAFAVLSIDDERVASEDVFMFADDDGGTVAEAAARNYWSTYNEGTPGFVDSCLTDDARFVVDGRSIGGGRESNRAAAEAVLAQFPNRRVEPIAVASGSNTVCARIRVSGSGADGAFSDEYIQVLLMRDQLIATEFNFSGRAPRG